ncbi:MAG: pyridoxamine 5'-phosphate oxidase, partial [Ignavibacteriaceae bacterium]
ENELNKLNIDKDPFNQFSLWMDEVLKMNIIEPNAMVLSTSDENNFPSSRVVLLKEVKEGEFIFYTNYESKKGHDLSVNPRASLLFYWRELGRQIRISGSVKKTTKEESENYFVSRPYESQISAWASRQSSTIPGRKFLVDKFEEIKAKYKKEVPLPSFWGGYKLSPISFEFWQGRENRLHDRIIYIREKSEWKTERLSP